METHPSLTAFLDDASVREIIAAMDDEARSTEILAYIGERRRRHQQDLETLWQIVNDARAERDDACRERDEMYREVEHLRQAVSHFEHQIEVLRADRQSTGPVARSVKRAVTAGRAVKRSLR